ncbi:MAG: electron transport complex subunit E [Treponema pedis]|uniref:electron transport complex subunit E n=1 Tax=Treponema pedis TaxID=409322 RepID=UPI0031340002
MNKLHIFTNGIIKSNPLLVLMIGLCSSLAVTTNVLNGLGMGVAMTFVIVMSELIISIFRKLIPSDIRIPVFIIVIASFTTIVDLLMQAYTPALSESMGLFIKLIVVNCIIMGRVESFASKETPGNSVLDALGMGIGYTLVLVLISAIRELIGAGSFAGIELFPERYRILFFANPPGGFFVFGLMISLNAAVKQLFEARLEALKKKKAPVQPKAETEVAVTAEEA